MSTIDLQKRIKYNKSKKKKKKKTKITIDRDNGVYVAVILLVLIGLLLVFTSSSYYALYEQGDLYFFIKNNFFLYYTNRPLACLYIKTCK